MLQSGTNYKTATCSCYYRTAVYVLQCSSFSWTKQATMVRILLYFLFINLRVQNIVLVVYQRWSFLDLAIIVYFTVTGGNEAGVDLVLIQPFLLCYVNHVVLMLTSIF